MEKLILILTAILISGCTTAMKTGTSYQSSIENIDYKNYLINKAQSAYVGEQLISRKAYKAIIKKDLYQTQSNFSLRGGLGKTAISLNASIGDTFKVAGENENSNTVVYIPGSIFMFGINNSGNWDGTVMSSNFWTSPIGSGNQYKMTPPDTKFEIIESKIPLSGNGYINHEIIFTGLGTNGINLLYREYTFENMARSDFKQELIYPANTKEIRFRNYLFHINHVSASEIKYIVKSE
jgi:hypothetical protein